MSRLVPYRVGKAATAVLVAIIGVVVLYLGIPRTIAAFLMLPGDGTLQRIRDGEAADPQELGAFVRSRRKALPWLESGRVWSDLGLAELLLAASIEEGERPSSDLVGRAVDSLRAGLSRAPASPHAWTRLAYAELLARGLSPAVASALAMSIRTARYEPGLMLPRLELCLVAWPHFLVEDRDLVLDQVQLAWRRSPQRLVDLAMRTDRAAVIRAALAQTPSDLSEFERRLRQSGS